MLLIDPAEAALAIGAKCNGATVSADNAQMILVLKYLTPRVEEALNVATLVRGVFVDSFYLPAMNPRSDRPVARLRLSNGFLVAGEAITVQDEDGEAVTVERVNPDLGLIEIETWSKGQHTVQYTSGFSVPADPDPIPSDYDPEAKVLVGVNPWIRELTVECMVAWFRSTNLNPRFDKNLNLSALDGMLRREIYLRVYGKYERPRMGHIFSENLSRGT